ncbi:MAG: RluA family pseudouridine synthase [Crocinitomicaceae bacterium]|nr:RluA family pseudouridine synthase [Crocinitomicaceae bacterium]
MGQQTHFISFKESTEHYTLPEKFTFPFYYDPHPLGLLAAKELQSYLETQTDWIHNFGIDPTQKGQVIGKMFGVLVVRNKNGKLGYLTAFSGKLAGSNDHPYFVPPVFDILETNGFFRKGEAIISAITVEIEALESDPQLAVLRRTLNEEEKTAAFQLDRLKNKAKEAKRIRRERRSKLKAEETSVSHEVLLHEMKIESLQFKAYYKDLTDYWTLRLGRTQRKLERFTSKIERLKKDRKAKSGALQQQIFDHYHFLNARGEEKSLGAIFKHTIEQKPPSGAGECAAPKLLQFAFLNELEPIALVEFWWGASPKSEIRKHKQYYPSCRGKCEPILGHMLEGMNVDDNPLLKPSEEKKEVNIVFEDEHIVVINKPHEFLSVPGKTISDCVDLRMHEKYPDATGPLIVHRLDMATSGLMLIAKTKEIHKSLQRQFIQRTINKRYVALLDGIISKNEGIIDLPLRVDLEDRPRQLVCYEHGKNAQTKFEVIERKEGKTRVHFFPITGRTHQLRMHSAHESGLNSPIVGDDLYGKKANRLHLHAELIEFYHPILKERITITAAPDF